MNDTKIRNFLLPTILSLVGIGISWAATVGFYNGNWSLIKLNYDYSPIGWFVRCLGILFSIMGLFISIKGNRLLDQPYNQWLAINLSIIGILWEIVSVAVILSLIFLVVGGMISGG